MDSNNELFTSRELYIRVGIKYAVITGMVIGSPYLYDVFYEFGSCHECICMILGLLLWIVFEGVFYFCNTYLDHKIIRWHRSLLKKILHDFNAVELPKSFKEEMEKDNDRILH